MRSGGGRGFADSGGIPVVRMDGAFCSAMKEHLAIPRNTSQGLAAVAAPSLPRDRAIHQRPQCGPAYDLFVLVKGDQEVRVGIPGRHDELEPFLVLADRESDRETSRELNC